MCKLPCSTRNKTDRWTWKGKILEQITNQWMLALGGFISVALGLIMFFQPAAGGLVLTLMIGSYAVMVGVLVVMLLRLRKWDVRPGNGDHSPLQTAR